jgi:hypothetical protein
VRANPGWVDDRVAPRWYLLQNGSFAVDFGGVRLQSSLLLVPNTWYHVAAVKIRSHMKALTTSLYINGVGVPLVVGAKSLQTCPVPSQTASCYRCCARDDGLLLLRAPHLESCFVEKQVDNYGALDDVDFLVTDCPPTSLMVGQGVVYGAPPSTRTLPFTGYIGELGSTAYESECVHYVFVHRACNTVCPVVVAPPTPAG